MNKDKAALMLEQTFRNEFDEIRFGNLIKELLNKFEVKQQEYTKADISKEFQDFIKQYKLFGKYEDEKGNLIGVLSVHLERTSSRDQARTKQRNFIAKYLKSTGLDAVLVAFFGEDVEDWRFSFIKLEYSTNKTAEGDVKTSEILTLAKRYSFLVGKNEPSHTAQSRLINLIVEEDINPTLSQIEEAFSIEKVTKEFFEEYKKLYLELKESLDEIIEKNKQLRNEFDEKGISTVDFTKKLLGQIVFIYFLQKKGWLGVEKDEKTGKFKEWGEGHKNFLRKLYERKIVKYDNFFNDILEPLFYEALAIERENHYYSRFKCKIPFLNGGLFEPLGGYNWTDTEILLENDIFEKILETFDRYNFTVKEDEPLEKEVAIDPEMLGKVFENLLEIKDRKSKGSYYTPREIVHYMCQESLINYLETKTGIDKKYIENFIHDGEISDVPKSIYKNRLKIDELLTNIKIVDPAIGSGAFPVGMLNEIVKARSVLTRFFDEMEQERRTIYILKRQCIENSLYGVDIDPSAIDIAQLRLWLSLIVDETDIHNVKPLPNLDYKIMCGNSLLDEFEGVKLFDERLLGEIKKDYSLELKQIDEGIKNLYQEFGEIQIGKKKDDGRTKKIKKKIKKLERKKQEIITGPKKEVNHGSLFGIGKKIKESQKKLKELNELHKQFFDENNRRKKNELRKEIEKLDWEFMGEAIKEKGDKEALKRLEEIKKTRSKPFFLWKLYFAEVFQGENPGFDIILANPPYVGHKGGQKEFFQEMKNTSLGKRFNNERMDLFYYFFHLGLDIGRARGEVAFITTNYYVTADSAIKLRTDFKNRTSIRKLVNFNELKIFDSARGQHNMLTLLTKRKDEEVLCEIYSTNRTGVATPRVLLDILSKTDKETVYYNLNQQELYEGNMNYIRLFYGKLKNKQSIDNILQKLKNGSKNLISICDLSQGMVSGIDRISQKHVRKFPSLNEGEGVYIVDLQTRKGIGESPLFKPWFKNSDISKYKVNEKNSWWVIHTHTELNLEKFQNIKKHLEKYKNVIKSRNYDSGELSKAKKLGKWWAMSSSRREFDFTKPKIISPQRSYQNTFAYTEKEWVASADVYFITIKDKIYDLRYILSLLNSKLYYLWLYFRGKRKGEMLELYLTPLSEIPIKEISPEQQKPSIELVNKILSITKDEDYPENPKKQAKVKEYEIEINQLVYKLYGLTKEEIEIVENFNKN